MWTRLGHFHCKKWKTVKVSWPWMWNFIFAIFEPYSSQSKNFFLFNFSPESTQMAITQMTQKKGLDLSNSCGSLLLNGTRRHPRSCSGSTESLPIFQPSGYRDRDDAFYFCPSGIECENDKLKCHQLVQHVNTAHQTPTIIFGSSSAEISLPPRLPIENASLVLEMDGKQFWVKVNVIEWVWDFP